HDRGQAFVFADYELSDDDLDRIRRFMPMEVRAMSIPTKILKEDEVWDLGTSTGPVAINVDYLEMHPGSSVVIRNTILSFTCQKLTKIARSAPPGSPAYDFGILGVTPDQVAQAKLDLKTYQDALNKGGKASQQIVQAFIAAKLPLSTNAEITVV